MDIEKAKILTDLPWATLLTLACGYVGYFIAHVGIRDHHKTVDVVFASFVFGFLSAFVFQIASRFSSVGILWASVASFAFAMIAGAAWNAFGRRLFYYLLRASKTTTSDDLPSAWAELSSERRASVTQVSVKLTDGTWLKCTPASRFDKSPHGSVVFGGNGDLLMYVTHVQLPTKAEFMPCNDVRYDGWGDEITYIPKDQIARIDIRKKWKTPYHFRGDGPSPSP